MLMYSCGECSILTGRYGKLNLDLPSIWVYDYTMSEANLGRVRKACAFRERQKAPTVLTVRA